MDVLWPVSPPIIFSVVVALALPKPQAFKLLWCKPLEHRGVVTFIVHSHTLSARS